MADGNLDGAVQGGAEGAKIGGQVGGGYGALIGGVIGAAIGWFIPDEELEAIEEHNKYVLRNTQQSMFDLQRQRNVTNLKTAQVLNEIQTQRREMQSTVNAQYSATDMIGSSAEALQQVIQYQATSAKAQTWLDFDIGVDNYNTQVSQIVNQGLNSLQTYRSQNGKSIDVSGMVNQGMNAYSQYQASGSSSNVAGSFYNSGSYDVNSSSGNFSWFNYGGGGG